MHREQGGRGTLGEPAHIPSAGGCVSDKLAAEQGGEDLLTPCLFWFSVFFKTLSWSLVRASS